MSLPQEGLHHLHSLPPKEVKGLIPIVDQTLKKDPSLLTYFAGAKICAPVYFSLNFHNVRNSLLVPVPVAARSEAWLCSRSLAGIAG